MALKTCIKHIKPYKTYIKPITTYTKTYTKLYIKHTNTYIGYTVRSESTEENTEKDTESVQWLWGPRAGGRGHTLESSLQNIAKL